MPEGLSRAQVEAIAALAQLELEQSEIELFVRQLGEILEYATQVQQLDTTGVPPTASVALRHAADRSDEVGPCLDRDDALMNAPDRNLAAGFFKVPRVIA